ncbi:unnamed protein product, partial [Closterium sp. NIES-54]
MAASLASRSGANAVLAAGLSQEPVLASSSHSVLKVDGFCGLRQNVNLTDRKNVAKRGRNVQRRSSNNGPVATLSEKGEYFTEKPPTPILDTVNYPIHMKNLSIRGRKNNVIAVIGDGAMTAGMVYEAMNNAGYLDSNMIVILNDNKQVSLPTATVDGPAPPVGALSSALSKLQSSRPLRELREVAKGVSKQIGGPVHEIAAKVDEYARGMISGSGSTLFEELGLYYIGPVDGHSVEDLVAILKEVKNTQSTGPVLIHVVTEKGRGYPYAERAADKYHGVVKFDPATGRQHKGKSATQAYTTYFAEALIAEAEQDKNVVAIHAAMGGGTGLNLFAKRFPERCFDVGIAEQHAVTFAAGMAVEGLKPFCAIYSSFLQRAYDQVMHDVALQKLPVRFAVDRAGLVGADGATHAGAYDVAFLACLPEMVVMAPADEVELFHMVATAAAYNEGPSVFRYPRGNGIGLPLPANNKGVPLE